MKERKRTDRIELSIADGETQEEALAQLILRPMWNGAGTIKTFSGRYGDTDIPALAESLAEQCAAVGRSDLSQAESLLLTQAQTLDAIFHCLAQRAAVNVGEYMDAADKYLRLALKAQSQCRATLQTLGEMKNPQPVAFVKQANITSGPQQINNGTMTHGPARAGENQNQPNELLGAQAYEQLDTRAPSAASRVDSTMAAMGAIDRASDGGR